jgi:hypothetical protein
MSETNPPKEGEGFRVVDRRGRDPEPVAAEPVEPPKTPVAPRPPVDFATFVLSFGSTALIQMGAAPHPDTGKHEADPVSARETIDLLGMLREKTRGNLTDEETKFFDALLYDLRVRFVELTRPK